MNKFLTIALLSSLAFFVVEGAIVYDPATNTYTNTTSGTKTTVTKAWSWSTSTASGSSTAKIATGAYSTSGALSKLHILLEKNQANLLERLDGYYTTLAKTLGAGSGTVDAPGRVDILNCMGILKSTSAPSGMDHVYDQLNNKVITIATTLHTEISALEKKLKGSSLDQVTQKLEQTILEQKVDSYLSEYTKVIDTFNTLFTEYTKEIDALVKDLTTNEQTEFDTYYEKVAAYQKLMTTYDLFLKKVKESGLAWDATTHSSTIDVTPFHGYLMSHLMFTRWDSVVALFPKDVALQGLLASATDALTKAHHSSLTDDAFLKDLYPLDDMKILSKSIASLRTAYTEKDGSFSCDAFATDKSVLVTSTELSTLMNKILNILQKELSTSLTERATKHDTALIATQKTALTTKLTDKDSAFLLRSASTKSDKELQTIRAFLQSAYRKGLDTNATDKFFAKLSSVLPKIDKALLATKDKGIIKRLDMIKQAIEEFLVK